MHLRLCLLCLALFGGTTHVSGQTTPILSGHWATVDTYQIDIAQSGCLRAMPDSTGMGACDFSGQPWVALVSRYGDSATAATPGRWYVLERGGEIVGRADVTWVAWFPLGANGSP